MALSVVANRPPGLPELPPGPQLPLAACRGMAPELFVPDQGGHYVGTQAKAVCARCPERTPCRQFALSVPWLVGIWGGLSTHERQLWRRGAMTATDGLVEELEIDADEASPAPSSNGSGPHCSECGAPLPVPARAGNFSRATCGNDCAGARRRRLKREARKRRPRPAPVQSTTTPNAGAPEEEAPEAWFIVRSALSWGAKATVTVGKLTISLEAPTCPA